MIPKDILAKVFRIFSGAVDALDQDQFDQLVTGKGKLIFDAPGAVTKAKTAKTVDGTAILQELTRCQDRDEARQALSAVKTKTALTSLARALKVHVAKRDRREDIETKVVEFVIGSRLRTQAIQSLDLTMGSGKHAEAGPDFPKASEEPEEELRS